MKEGLLQFRLFAVINLSIVSLKNLALCHQEIVPDRWDKVPEPEEQEDFVRDMMHPDMKMDCIATEIGRQKKNSPTFSKAHLYTPAEIRNHLTFLGTQQFRYAVYYDSNFELLDEQRDKGNTHPAFIATIVQKRRNHADHH